MPDFSNFDCDQCGACCRKLIVEANLADCQQEPKLYALAKSRPWFDEDKFRAGDQGLMLWDSKRKCCPFLGDDSNCTIYATRPNECIAVEPGDAKCQQARAAAGLELLRDRDGNEITRELLEESCEEYDLNYDDWFAKDGSTHG